MRLTFISARLLPWLTAQRARLLALFAGVLIPLYIFGSLAEDVLEHQSVAFDNALLMFVHTHATPLFDRAMLFFSLIGSARVLIPVHLIVISIFLWRRRSSVALFWLLATGGAALLNVAAKHSFLRVRPSLWVSIAPETTYSFPSGHAMESMAVAAAFIALTWNTRWRWVALAGASIFVICVGASRVYLGVHYPTDIAAAWVASLAWVVGLLMLFRGRLSKPGPASTLPLT